MVAIFDCYNQEEGQASSGWEHNNTPPLMELDSMCPDSIKGVRETFKLEKQNISIILISRIVYDAFINAE